MRRKVAQVADVTPLFYGGFLVVFLAIAAGTVRAGGSACTVALC
jgi:hypothetical protein